MNDHHGRPPRLFGAAGMSARRMRARYEWTRARARARQLRTGLSSGFTGLSSGFGQPAPVHPEDAALTKALAGAITGPGKDPADDQARDGIRADGLPAEHPESMVLELSPADEVWLAALSNDLWPADEYQQIIAEDYRQRNGGAS
jgi:hypothetical protein